MAYDDLEIQTRSKNLVTNLAAYDTKSRADDDSYNATLTTLSTQIQDWCATISAKNQTMTNDLLGSRPTLEHSDYDLFMSFFNKVSNMEGKV